MIDEPAGYVCPLRPRELETIKLAAEGRTTKQIAYDTGVSTRMIDRYLASAKERLGPRTLPGLVAYVMRKGWIQ